MLLKRLSLRRWSISVWSFHVLSVYVQIYHTTQQHAHQETMLIRHNQTLGVNGRLSLYSMWPCDLQDNCPQLELAPVEVNDREVLFFSSSKNGGIPVVSTTWV